MYMVWENSYNVVITVPERGVVWNIYTFLRERHSRQIYGTYIPRISGTNLCVMKTVRLRINERLTPHDYGQY